MTVRIEVTGLPAERFVVAPSPLGEQLAVLKRAGLLTTRRRGRYVLYELDLGAGARLGSDFLEVALR